MLSIVMREQHTYNLNLPYRKIIVLRLKRKIVLFRQVRLMLSDKCYSCPSDFLCWRNKNCFPRGVRKGLKSHLSLYSSKLCECVFKLFDVLQLSTKVFCRLHETNRGGLKKFFFFIEIVSHKNSFCAPGTLAWMERIVSIKHKIYGIYL